MPLKHSWISCSMDVSADIDVMENMLRADGLAGDTPFKL